MSQSLFVKPCNQCKGSGKTGDIHKNTGVCPECNGARYEVDFDYLRLFERKIWEVPSNEKDRYLSLVQAVNEGIEFVRSLPDYPNGFLAQLYHIRADLFQFLVAFNNEPVYFTEAMRSLRISNELSDSASEDK